MLDKADFLKGLIELSAIFRAECDEVMQTGYYQALCNMITTEQFNRAKVRLVKEWKFWGQMPLPADIISRAETDDGKKAELQAHIIITQIRVRGYIDEPKFSDASTAAYVRRFGWENLCRNFKVENTSFFVNDFKRFYLAAAESDNLPALDGGDRVRVGGGDKLQIGVK